jgi:FHA domain
MSIRAPGRGRAGAGSARRRRRTGRLDRRSAGRFRWHLTDLQSTNGTFVRIGNALLRHQQELLIGSRRYRFDAAPRAPR